MTHEDTDPDDIIARLSLRPHPEGGWYAETWRTTAVDGGRATSSAIYFLLRQGERSAWHRVDADETWHFYAGSPLELGIAADGRAAARTILGVELAAGERPQATVPAGSWQAARSLGSWTLVGCTVSPAFEFEGFELAVAGWEPSGG
ncbi:MAG: cupin domain-containing protein [Chloroflexi bacterium]|nr:cupin domain-containing protein [Chloroflexota bacterium]MBF6606828.1 cupin domain-containing protein [Chloroflexota bacterium]